MSKAASLTGDELIPIVQAGDNKTTTVQKVKEGLATSADLANKVDKDGSKVLSDVNFTSTLKTKLDGIAENANNYTHPTTAGNKHIPAGGSSGQILKWSAAGTAVWGAEKSYSEATTGAAGLMSAADKTKLNGIANNANNYTHPANHPASIITEDTTHRFVTDTEKSTWNAKASTAVASTSANGLMSSADKSKLNGIAAQANRYVLPAAGTSIGGVKQGTAVEDATSADDIVAQFNALLASLRTAGVLATGAAAASFKVMSTSVPSEANSEDVIDFVPPMSIEKGKLYKENGIIYECIQTSKLPISNKLSDLVGYYVEIV